MDPTGVVYNEMRPLPEQPDMVGYPLPHSLGTQRPVQGRSTVKVIVLGSGGEERKIEGTGWFCQGRDGVGEVEFGVTSSGCGGVEKERPSRVVQVNGMGEGTIHHDHSINAAIAPVRENLVSKATSDVGVVLFSIGRKPLALVRWAGVEMEGLGGEANDGKGVGAAPVGAHGDEVIGGSTVGVECTP